MWQQHGEGPPKRASGVCGAPYVQPIWTRRVIWPLLSQYVFLFAMRGSVIAGWTLPAVSVARDVMACSPAVASGQDSDQNFQVNSDPAPSVMVAGIQGPPSTWTSTLAIGAPQAAPTIL